MHWAGAGWNASSLKWRPCRQTSGLVALQRPPAHSSHRFGCRRQTCADSSCVNQLCATPRKRRGAVGPLERPTWLAPELGLGPASRREARRGSSSSTASSRWTKECWGWAGAQAVILTRGLPGGSEGCYSNTAVILTWRLFGGRGGELLCYSCDTDMEVIWGQRGGSYSATAVIQSTSQIS